MVEVVVGGFYKSADGEKVGPMTINGEFFAVDGGDGLRLWWKNGQRYSRENSHNDLIAEWVDEPDAPVAPATEVEDGKWIAWNGGDCPVHPKTVVEYITAVNGAVRRESSFGEALACLLSWVPSEDGWVVVAYRVIKEYRDPREFWAYGCELFGSKELAVKRKYDDFRKGIILRCSEVIHVREVIEPEIDQAVK